MSDIPFDSFTVVKGANNLSEQANGKVIVLEFWATWCGPCVRTVPHLSSIAQRYSDQGLLIVGITSETPDVVSRSPLLQQMDYVVVYDTLAWGTQLMRSYNVRGIPHAFVYGRDRKLLWHG